MSTPDEQRLRERDAFIDGVQWCLLVGEDDARHAKDMADMRYGATPSEAAPVQAGERQALAELVACKDLKERIKPYVEVTPGVNTYREQNDAMNLLAAKYERRQPLAWAAARAALTKPAAPAREAGSVPAILKFIDSLPLSIWASGGRNQARAELMAQERTVSAPTTPENQQ